MAKKSDIEIQQAWSSPLLGLVALLVLGSLVAYYVPSLSNTTSGLFTRVSTVSFHQIVALVLLSALTVIYLAYFRAKFYFSTRWLVAVVSYNFLILFIKLTLSTHELAGRVVLSFTTIITTAFLVSLLYIAAFTILYLFFDGKVLNKSWHRALIVSTEGKVLLAMGLFVCATIARILVFRLPYLSSTNASAYLGDVFKTDSALLSVLLFIMIFGAVEAYAQVRRRSDLKYFFVTGTGLVLTFHLWWAIFIFRGH